MLSSVIEKQVVPSNNNDSATDLLPLPTETGFLFKIIYLEIIIFCPINHCYCPDTDISAKFKSVKLSHACMKLDHPHTILFWLCHPAIPKAIK